MTVCLVTRSKVKVKVTSAWKPPKRSRPSVPHGTNFFQFLYKFNISITMPELLGTPSQISCWGFTCTTMGDLSPRRPNLLYHFQKRSAAPSTRQRDDAVHTENDRHYNGVCGKKQKEEYYEESNESKFIEVHCFHCMILIWKSIKMILLLQPWALLVTLVQHCYLWED